MAALWKLKKDENRPEGLLRCFADAVFASGGMCFDNLITLAELDRDFENAANDCDPRGYVNKRDFELRLRKEKEATRDEKQSILREFENTHLIERQILNRFEAGGFEVTVRLTKCQVSSLVDIRSQTYSQKFLMCGHKDNVQCNDCY